MRFLLMRYVYRENASASRENRTCGPILRPLSASSLAKIIISSINARLTIVRCWLALGNRPIETGGAYMDTPAEAVAGEISSVL